MHTHFVCFKNRLHTLLAEELGQGVIEFILLMGLMGLLIASGSTVYSSAINRGMSSVSRHLKQHVNHGKHLGQE